MGPADAIKRVSSGKFPTITPPIVDDDNDNNNEEVLEMEVSDTIFSDRTSVVHNLSSADAPVFSETAEVVEISPSSSEPVIKPVKVEKKKIILQAEPVVEAMDHNEIISEVILDKPDIQQQSVVHSKPVVTEKEEVKEKVVAEKEEVVAEKEEVVAEKEKVVAE